jgi:hypothetical protein
MIHPDHWTREERHVLRPFDDNDETNPFETAREIARLIERHAPRDQAEVWELVGVHLRSTGAVLA